MKQVLLFVFLCMSAIAIAQPPAGANRAGGTRMNAGHFYGKVVDSKTNKGLELASVQLIGNKMDSVTKKPTEVILATALTQPNGDFSLEKLPVFGNFKLRVTSVGYQDYESPVSFNIKMPQGGGNGGDQQDRMQQMIGMVDRDLGNIKLDQTDANLANVTVTSAAKPFFEMGVDRKIFNVDKNIVTTGQTASELMKQIPSLNVDIDGNVTLRNAAPTLFVDGRPTTLTLDQIPADIIDKVELVTNPSAKYDASGGTAGILNIVLKKNKKTGYNGGVRAGVDSRGRINGGIDLNVRQNKFNFFVSANYNQRKSKYTGDVDRYNFGTNPSTVNQNSDGTNQGYFGFFRVGFDYLIDIRNTVTIAANYNRGQFNSNEDQVIDSVINNIFETKSLRYAENKRNFHNLGTQLSYKHNFAKNGHDITADVNYNSSTNDGTSFYSTRYYDQFNAAKYFPLLQQTIGNGGNKFVTIQSDYENPITENTKIEAGVRAAIRDFTSDNLQYIYDYGINNYKELPSISSRYKYKDQVYAAYGTYTIKNKKWNYQLGLRVESSNYDGTLLGKDSAFKVKFPVSLFPSAFITYRLTDKQDLQMNYSRRINRPNFWQLLPFLDNTDPLNLSIGNAGLKPEFTNSFEFNYNNAYTKGANFLVSAYVKYSTNLITNYIYRDINPDTALAKTDSVYYSTFVNARNSWLYGLEFTNRITVWKFWDMTTNLNLYNSKINGDNLSSQISSQRWSWFVKMNNNFKLPKGFSVQLSGDYQAKTVLPANSGGGRGGGFWGGSISSAQGYINPRYSFDFAVRKEWTWKGGNSASLTLSMNDFLRTQLFSTYTESAYFVQNSERRRDPQILRMNFNYRFGKFDANLFKRRNLRVDQGGGDQGMMQ